MPERIRRAREQIQELAPRIGELSPDKQRAAQEMLQRARKTIERLQDRDVADIIEAGERVPALEPIEPPRDDMEAVRAAERAQLPAEEALQRMVEDRREMIDPMRRERDTAREERRDLAEEQRRMARERAVEPIVREEMAERIDPLRDEQLQALEQVRAYRSQLAQVQNERAAALGMVEQRSVATPYLTGEQERISRAYDRREAMLTAKTQAENAHVQALSGMKEQARANISQIVNAYTYDTELELRSLENLQQVKSEEIAELDRDIQESFQFVVQEKRQQLERERQDRDAVLNMMVQYERAGVNPDDDVSTAAKKVSQWIGAQPAPEIQELMVNFPDAGINRQDTMEDALEKISSLPDPDVRQLMMSIPAAEIREDMSIDEAIQSVRNANLDVKELAMQFPGAMINHEADNLQTALQKIAAQEQQELARQESLQREQMSIQRAQISPDRQIQELRAQFDAGGGERAWGVSFDDFVRKSLEGEGAEQLSILDYQRYDDSFPDAGVLPSDTTASADLKVSIEYELKPRVMNLFDDGYTPQQIIDLYAKETGVEMLPQEKHAVMESYDEFKIGDSDTFGYGFRTGDFSDTGTLTTAGAWTVRQLGLGGLKAYDVAKTGVGSAAQGWSSVGDWVQKDLRRGLPF